MPSDDRRAKPAGLNRPAQTPRERNPMSFPLPESNPEALGLDPRPLERLCATIERHVAEGHQPGAQVAIARHGKLALFRSFGKARVAPQGARDNASPDAAADA